MDTTPLTVEVAASFARRADPDVRIVLTVADAPAAVEPEQLRLRTGKRTVRVPVQRRTTPEGTVFEASVPDARLRSAVWELAVLGGEGPTRRETALLARLLTKKNQPVALLPGPTPSTRLPAPHPRPEPEAAGRLQPRVRAVAVRTVDGALSVLPDDVAARYREKLARAARRILS